MFGGDLRENPLFIHIVSIGYEFETHDVSKFSLCDNGVDLVNSSLSLRNLPHIGLEHTHHPSNATSVKLRIHNSKEVVYEYFQEPQSEDNVKETQFYILNDIGDIDFSDMLAEMYNCKQLKEMNGIDKNDLYKFVSSDNQHNYNIKFIEDGDFSIDCESFTGIEFVCTFLKPERHKNVIINTFVDACRRIFNHFSKLERIRGELMILDNVKQKKFEKVGFISNRMLYHYPDTNLYYMQTYDNSDMDYFENPAHKRSLGQAIFIPQMTVGIKATHAVEVVRTFMEKNNTRRRNRSVEGYLYDFDEIWKATKLAFGDSVNDTQRTRFSYFFFIIYTLYYYLRVFVPNKDKYEYFKDSVPILSRYCVSHMFIRLCRMISRKHAMELCTHHAIEELLQTTTQSKKTVKSNNKQYGNPEYSLRSFFDFCLKPPSSSISDDWFEHVGITNFSTHFKIIDPKVIIVENRIFNMEIQLAMQNQSDIHFNYGNYGTTLLDLKRYIEKITPTPVTSCGRITCVTKKYKPKSSKQSRKNSKK
jgi:hypothetical protein